MKLLISATNWTDRALVLKSLQNFKHLFVMEESDSSLTTLKRIKQNHFDLLVTFMDFPVLHGEELIEKIRVFNSDIPIIVINSSKNFDQLKRLLPYKIEEYLIFPNFNADLESCIKRLFPIAINQCLDYSSPINSVITIITNHYPEPLTLENLASYVYLSPNYLSNLFKKEVGKSVTDFIIQFRLEIAKNMLNNEHLKINFIASMVGFNNISYFNRLFKKHYGKTPTTYRSLLNKK